MDNLPSSSNFPFATPHLANGQASLRRLLAPAMNIQLRSLTGGVLWLALAALAGVQQIGPAGISIPAGPYVLLVGGATAIGLLCVIARERVSQRTFVVAEQVLLGLSWTAIAAMVALTDGAASADMALFATAFCYAAYFLAPRAAVIQISFGTIALWAPLVYDQPAVEGSGFIVRAAAMTVVLWTTAVVIARNAAALRDAETATRRLALADPLTGVANMRTFDAAFAEELLRAYDTGGTFGIAFMDVNGLKTANTVLGHAGGDKLIQDTARALISSCGENDQVARLGGDEFAVLLAAADSDRIASFQERFAIALDEINGPVTRRGPQLSVSIGVAEFPEDGENLDELMHAADTRMYDSKAALPPGLPIPETSGGRRLSRGRAHHGHHLPIGDFSGAGPALAWLLAALVVAITQFSVAGDGEAIGHRGLALSLAMLLAVVALSIQLVPDRMLPAVRSGANALAIAITLPVIYATGGLQSAALPLVFLVVADASFSLPAREAGRRAVLSVAVLAATLLFGEPTTSLKGVILVGGTALVIAYMLKLNRAAIEDAQRQALALSMIDPLTNVANRRAFEDALIRAGTARAGGRRGGGLVLIDADDFKNLNKTSGHQGGDEVLRTLAAVLEGAVPGPDRVCRIGGDEFAIVVYSGDEHDVARIAASSRAAVHEVDWSGFIPAGLTVSVGFSTWNAVDEWQDLVVAADLALRMSKDTGKDAIASAPAGPGTMGPSVSIGAARAARASDAA